jgi:hypothetical protein
MTAVRTPVQDGASCLFIASQNGHLEVVKHLCEIGGKELLMLTANVSGLGISDAPACVLVTLWKRLGLL